MGKAGLENLCNDVFPEALVLDMHHGIVALRIEGLARFAEGLDAQRVEDLDKLCQGHLHALFIGLVCGLVMQGPLEVIIDGKELFHRIGNGILIDAVLFALRALAEVVIFCSQPQKLIVLLRLRGLGLLQRIGLFGLGLLLGAFRLLRRFRLLGGAAGSFSFFSGSSCFFAKIYSSSFASCTSGFGAAGSSGLPNIRPSPSAK